MPSLFLLNINFELLLIVHLGKTCGSMVFSSIHPYQEHYFLVITENITNIFIPRNDFLTLPWLNDCIWWCSSVFQKDQDLTHRQLLSSLSFHLLWPPICFEARYWLVTLCTHVGELKRIWHHSMSYSQLWECYHYAHSECEDKFVLLGVFPINKHISIYC